MEENKTATKSVGYSYPSSPNAVRFGFRDGCWSLEIVGSDNKSRAVGGYSTRVAAFEAAARMEIPWNKYSIRPFEIAA